MTKLKGVVIGCGAIAREHLAAVGGLQNAEIAAVCDLSPARAEATAERFRIPKWFVDYERMIAEIRPDLVHITTPPAAHVAIAKTCLSAGLNVLCEKPVVINQEDFAALRQLATDRRCFLLENQNLRYHSSVRRIAALIDSGELGDVVNVQICVSVPLGAGTVYADRNAAHFGSVLRGGAIGDFLPHIAYLVLMFTGPVVDLRTIWTKRQADSPLPADEFRGLVKGTRASASVSFSGNAQPTGFWLRVTGSKMHVECNLYEPPRLSIRRLRKGEPALMTAAGGIAESRAILWSSLAGFWRKLGGVSSYDGLPEFVASVYRAVETHQAQPVSLDELEQAVRLVDQFTRADLRL
jgi:predicted dehydrogenase